MNIQVFYDRVGSSLIIWFDDPQKEAICEEFDEDTVLMKDKDGRVIGVEKMNIKAASMKPMRWAFRSSEQEDRLLPPSYARRDSSLHSE